MSETLTQEPTQTQETVSMYRVENPNIPANPDGVVSHEDLVGQWFSPNIDTALRYLKKSSQGRGGAIEGSQLVVARVPESDIDDLHVSKHPIASQMDVEPDNYLISRDGMVPMETVPLDSILGELRGHLGNFNNLKEAQHRIRLAVALGEAALK